MNAGGEGAEHQGEGGNGGKKEGSSVILSTIWIKQKIKHQLLIKFVKVKLIYK